MDKYILVDRQPVRCNDIMKWGEWLNTAERHVGDDRIGDVRISTVFLGLDHGAHGRPLLFETMIFGGPRDQHCWRCSTWEEAKARHAAAIALIRAETEQES